MICSPWISTSELEECEAVDGATEQQKLDAIQVASEILYALSGRQYPGLCQETIRPCSGGMMLAGFSWARWSYPMIPLKTGGTWLNIGPNCGCHVSWECACSGIPQVNLGRHDVRQIFSVNIDGVILASSNYRLDHGVWLVRTDGEQWPCCQNLAEDIGETGTWYIELEYGTEPPESAKAAARKLGTELVKACANDATCRLPQRVTNLTRQGVSMTLMDPQEFITEGRTGLYEVDLWIHAVNPQGIARRATAWSPEVLGRARRVGALGS